MTVGKVVFLYRGWVREKPMRELLTALGVVVGVALVFATLTMNGSIYSASSNIIKALAGRAELQATARGADGVPEGVARQQFPGVIATARALEAPLALRHGDRTVATQLIGVSPDVLRMNRVVAGAMFGPSGLVLPAALAQRLHLQPHESVTVLARGRASTARVQAVLGSEAIGPLADSLVAFGYLRTAQRVLGMQGRITTVLARPQPGRAQLARTSLTHSLSPLMQVGGVSRELSMLREALRPQADSTSFFVLLAVVVGVLLVATATMLSAADRRREMAALWLQGYSRRQLVAIVLFQGLVLGFVGSLIGVLLGSALAAAYAESPDYLAAAFPLGSGTVISVPLAIAALLGGTVIACACVAWVLLDVRGLRDAAIPAPKAVRPLARNVALVIGVALALLSAIVSSSLLAALLLAVVVLLVVPSVLAMFTHVADLGAAWRRITGSSVAAGGIRAAELRAVALAVTAGIGVFGAVVAVDVHGDLLSGLEGAYERYVSSAKLWVTSPADDLAVSPLSAAAARRTRAAPGVRSVRPYYGGWLDMDGRRLWLIARAAPQIPAGQVVRGSRKLANEELAKSGSVAISDQLARALAVEPGEHIEIPTPGGLRSLRLVATTTNLGWSSGLVFLPVADYLAWFGGSPTALEVEAPTSALPGLRRALGAGVDVQTAQRRADIADALPRQGLHRLSEIAWLLVVAVSVAVALGLSSAVWQRRPELASLRLQSFAPWALQRLLAWEALIVVGAGILVGALAGAYGHAAADRYLRTSTGYPVSHSGDAVQVLGVAALVVIVTSLIIAVPGFLASRAPMRLALDGR